MKKLISIMLTLLMVATVIPVAPVAFAAGDGMPLTINIENDSNDDIYIGSGEEYYDEDGYIVTGTNENAAIKLQESCNLTLDGVTAYYLSDMTTDQTIYITVKGDNIFTDSLSLYKSDVTINFDDGATLKAKNVSTSGNDGTCTVNGGNLILDYQGNENYSNINCEDFIINSGTVTASNNYYSVVMEPVKLNGGTLNIISTSTVNEAIYDVITVNKGALLTVSVTGSIFGYGAELLMADGLAKDNTFFVRYDTESDFVPVYNVTDALEGETYAQIKVDSHTHSIVEGTCSSCGYTCAHESFTDLVCDVCGYKCEHDWSNYDGICAIGCGTTCAHENYENGECDYCGYACTHESFTDLICDECGYECEHDWSNCDGICAIGCGTTCAHESSPYGICEVCSYNCPHENYADGKCPDCDASGKIVSLFMEDSYGDGWNGNAVKFGLVVDGDYKQILFATFEDDSEYAYSIIIPEESIFYLKWVDGDYSDECALTVKIAGETVFEVDDCEGYDNGELIYVSCEHTYQKGVCSVCGFACSHESFTDLVCDECGYVCEHDWSNCDGICATGCGTVCEHENRKYGVCEVCSYNCPHENYADGECPDCGTSGKMVSVLMEDDYGDGWNGNGVELGVVVDKEYKKVVTATFEDGYGDVCSIIIPEESICYLKWINGKYSDECALTVEVDGEAVFETDECFEYSDGELIYISCEHTYEKGVCSVCGCACKHDTDDGVCSICGWYVYTITHQPTAVEPYVELNDDADATYQWFVVGENSVEVVDGYENIDPYDDAHYEEETGWYGEWYDEEEVGYFCIYLEKGDRITIIPNAYCSDLNIWDEDEYEYGTDGEFDAGEELVYTAEFDGWYDVYAYSDESEETAIRAYINKSTYTEAEDEISAELENPEIGTQYACKVSFADGTTEMSEVFEYVYAISHQPTEDEPYVELNDDTDAAYQWQKIEEVTAEVTDTNATPRDNYDDLYATYDPATGWTGTFYNENEANFFTIELTAGQTITMQADKEAELIGIWSEEYDDWKDFEQPGTDVVSFTAEYDDLYNVYAYVDEDTHIRAYVDGVLTYTEIEGETSAEIKNIEYGNKYACEVTFADGTTEMSDTFKYVYAIIHQPTEDEPYVELNYDTDASYQWYTVDSGVSEITDEDADVFNSEDIDSGDVDFVAQASYSASTGWSPTAGEIPGGFVQYYFFIDLKEDEKIDFEFSSLPQIVLFATLDSSDPIPFEPDSTEISYTASSDGRYVLAVIAESIVNVKAYMDKTKYTVLDGQTTDTLTPTALGNYACEVTFADGTTEMSEIFEVTTLHKCDFSGEWKYDAENHWKECADENCDKISGKALHEFGEYVSNNDATYSADGTKTAVCSCGKHDTVADEGTKLILGRTKSITDGKNTTDIALRWDAVEGATGYRVFVRENGKWVQVLKARKNPWFRDTALEPGTKRTYAVRAFVIENNSVIWSPTFTTISTATRPMSDITITDSTRSTSTVLTWTQSKGAECYCVFRYNATAKKWQYEKYVDGTSTTITDLANNGKYIFAVRAYVRAGATKIWATEFSKITVLTGPAAPVIRAASTASGRATVAWADVNGETGYQLWYSTSADGGFKKVANYKADTAKVYANGFDSAKTYYFTVRAYKVVGDSVAYGSFSNVVALKIK